MTTKLYKIFKETSVPVSWVANSVYFVTHATNSDITECYVTSSTGIPRRILNEADITSLIASQITSANELKIVADITARNALAPTKVMAVYVINATGDGTVTSGGAYYLFNPTGSAWIKTGEGESMDVSLTWANITGKPSSTPAQIDSAVSNSHTHANKTQLDKVGEDGGGNLTYNSTLPYTGWETTNW